MRRALWLVLLAGCARLSVTPAITTRPWPVTAPLAALVRVVREADGYVLGTVEKAEQKWIYDDVCGVIAGLLGKCNETHTYRLTIRNADRPFPLYVFVPRGDTLALPVGTYAVFIWRMAWVRQLGVCAERMRRGVGNYCESDNLPVLTSRDAVVAPEDSALVSHLFGEKP